MHLDVNIGKSMGSLCCEAKFRLSNRRSGVFGPSGSGKTTLLSMLAGLLKPDYGTIALNGITLFDSKKNIDLPPDKRRVGVVFQHSHLFPHLSVRKNLFYGYRRTPGAQRKLDPARVVTMLQLETLLDRSVQKLSGGERQRVALGRTLLACPLLVLLDEPLAGLDRNLKERIIPHLKTVFEELSIPFLFTSHSRREMQLMTRKILFVEHGRVTEEIRTEHLARRIEDNCANRPTVSVHGHRSALCGNGLDYGFVGMPATIARTPLF
jgi:molybdate transport system ATP-binding protein